MLPAFHGEKMEALRGLVTDVAGSEVDGWPPAARSRSTPTCSGSRSR